MVFLHSFSSCIFLKLLSYSDVVELNVECPSFYPKCFKGQGRICKERQLRSGKSSYLHWKICEHMLGKSACGFFVVVRMFIIPRSTYKVHAHSSCDSCMTGHLLSDVKELDVQLFSRKLFSSRLKAASFSLCIFLLYFMTSMKNQKQAFSTFLLCT